jgi:hypothetical protein
MSKQWYGSAKYSMRECEGTRIRCSRKICSSARWVCQRIRVHSEISSSMICMINATS